MNKLFFAMALLFVGMSVNAQHLGSEYRLKKVIPVAGRQGIAIDSNYYYVSDTKVLYKYDKQGNLVMKNDQPFQNPEIANHFGDIDIYNGEIYCGIEKFEYAHTFKLIRIFNRNNVESTIYCSRIFIIPIYNKRTLAQIIHTPQ